MPLPPAPSRRAAILAPEAYEAKARPRQIKRTPRPPRQANLPAVQNGAANGCGNHSPPKAAPPNAHQRPQ